MRPYLNRTWRLVAKQRWRYGRGTPQLLYGHAKSILASPRPCLNEISFVSSNLTADALVILNMKEPVVKHSIMSGFNKLVKSFASGARTTFEVDFEMILKSFYAHQLLNASHHHQEDAHKADLASFLSNLGEFKKINSSVTFISNETGASCQDNLPQYPNRWACDRTASQSANKFGVLINRIRSAISIKVKNSTKHLGSSVGANLTFSSFCQGFQVYDRIRSQF